jgi:6-phosphogluconolactonase
MEHIVFDDAPALAAGVADLIQPELEASGRTALGLAGGSTPRATYEELAARSIDWSTTAAWLTDERWVAPMGPDANNRMVRDALVRSTGVQFLAPDTTLRLPEIAAERFTQTLVSVLATVTRRITILGIGTDGHTASLFPGTSALNSGGPRYVENFVPSLDVWRLTATFDLIAESDIVLFVVSGATKAATIASIATGADVPAAAVTAREQVIWLLDREAASEL